MMKLVGFSNGINQAPCILIPITYIYLYIRIGKWHSSFRKSSEIFCFLQHECCRVSFVNYKKNNNRKNAQGSIEDGIVW